jgi:hypothetical protein
MINANKKTRDDHRKTLNLEILEEISKKNYGDRHVQPECTRYTQEISIYQKERT